MQWKTIFCAVVCAVATALVNTASAALITGNGSLSDPTGLLNGGRSFGAHDGYGVFFSMAGTSATLKSASVLMQSSEAVSKTFNARIYNPGDIASVNPTPVASASFNASFASASTKWFSVDFGAGTNLAASTNYIFAVEEAVEESATSINWQQPNSSASYSSDIGVFVQTGTFYQRSDGATEVYTSVTDNTKFGFQLSTEAVPEPSSLALMSMGLASVAAAARKARKKKAAVVGASTGEPAV